VTSAGVLVLDLLSLALVLWVLNLVRLGRLYVGYGALFVAVLLFTASAVTVPPIHRLLAEGLAFFFPVSGPAVLGFAFVVWLLVYILTQMTILSNRLSSLVQELALRRAGAEAETDRAPHSPPEGPSRGPA
jgi:hypothetical protein